MPKLKGFAVVALGFVLAFPSLGRAQDDLHLDYRSTPRLRELTKRTLRLLIQEGDSGRSEQPPQPRRING